VLTTASHQASGSRRRSTTCTAALVPTRYLVVGWTDGGASRASRGRGVTMSVIQQAGGRRRRGLGVWLIPTRGGGSGEGRGTRSSYHMHVIVVGGLTYVHTNLLKICNLLTAKVILPFMHPHFPSPRPPPTSSLASPTSAPRSPPPPQPRALGSCLRLGGSFESPNKRGVNPYGAKRRPQRD